MFWKIFTFLGDLLRSFLDPYGSVPPEKFKGQPGGRGGAQNLYLVNAKRIFVYRV